MGGSTWRDQIRHTPHHKNEEHADDRGGNVIGRIVVSLFSRGRHARFDRTADEKVKTADARRRRFDVLHAPRSEPLAARSALFPQRSWRVFPLNGGGVGQSGLHDNVALIRRTKG
jgi:hypothetical protein